VRVYVADELQGYPTIDIISGEIGLFQSAIEPALFNDVEKIQRCDVILVPHDAYFFDKDKDYVKYLNEISRYKPLVFSDRGDFPKKTNIRRGISLRVALGPGESAKNKILIPYNVESLERLPLQRYSDKPQLSFVGYVPRFSKGRALKSLLQSPLHPFQGNASYIRKMSVGKLEKTNFDSKIIRRGTYGAHLKTVQNVTLSRDEYLNSIMYSDFVLAPRGDANQSARFYEILSAGRIPIVPNSRMRFPVPIESFPQVIQPLLNLSVGVNRTFDNAISSAWKQIGDQSNYESCQREIRSFFIEHLEFNAFIKRLFASSVTCMNRKFWSGESQ
jgi:hypothetical protein